MTAFIVLLIYSIIFGIWGYNQGARRQIGNTSGFFLGFFLGLLGVIIVLCSEKIRYYSPANPAPSKPDNYAQIMDNPVMAPHLN